MSILRFTHIGICVSDLERALRFYHELLGFKLVSELEVAGEPAERLLQLRNVKLRAVYLERDGMRIELLHYSSPGSEGDGAPRAMNAHGLTHLSLRVDDMEPLLIKLRQAGVKVLEHTRVYNPQFRAGAVLITDPDGTLVELVQSPGDPAVPPGA